MPETHVRIKSNILVKNLGYFLRVWYVVPEVLSFAHNCRSQRILLQSEKIPRRLGLQNILSIIRFDRDRKINSELGRSGSESGLRYSHQSERLLWNASCLFAASTEEASTFSMAASRKPSYHLSVLFSFWCSWAVAANRRQCTGKCHEKNGQSTLYGSNWFGGKTLVSSLAQNNF